ncbi:hypothetical protein [Nostoc sp.]|uniref:hypothetical protein n=1 Tax=Nostoc sp. TaxID=1180 RepID=UPI002FFC08E4
MSTSAGNSLTVGFHDRLEINFRANRLKSTEVDWRFLAIFSHLQMTLAMRREFQFPADKRFHVKLTPMPLPHHLFT